MHETAPDPAPDPSDGPAPGADPSGPPARPREGADCAQRLAQRFPALFGGGAKPLKLRIQADIQALAPGEFTRQELSAFFRRHTGSTSYLFALVKGTARFGLDGAPAGEISEEHRRAAADELARRRAIREERSRLEDQQRRNRATLLRDFERTTLTPANFCALKGIALEELDGLLAIARAEAVAEAQQRAQPGLRDRAGGPGGARPGERHGRGRPRETARR
jgi:ProP effector